MILAFVSGIVLVIGVALLDGDSSSVPGISLACAGGGLLFASMCWAIWRQINNYVIRQGRTGQTWGKAKKGLWVLNETTGAAPGWASCLARWFLHGVINQAVYLDYLWPLWDQPKTQTLTDKILTTVVVKRG